MTDITVTQQPIDFARVQTGEIDDDLDITLERDGVAINGTKVSFENIPFDSSKSIADALQERRVQILAIESLRTQLLDLGRV